MYKDVARVKFGELIGISTVSNYWRYYCIAIVEGIIRDFTGEKEWINGINII